jgi:hypothetical protein
VGRGGGDSEMEEECLDDKNNDNYGPTPTADMWAGGGKLELDSKRLEDGKGKNGGIGREEDDEDDEDAP